MMTAIERNAISYPKPVGSRRTRAFVAVWSHRILAWEMAKRELMLSNKGALLGVTWLIIRPFVQVAALVVVVAVVFRVHLGQNGGRFDYALYVLAGMVPWQILAKSLEEAPSLVRTRVEILKQVIYPLEILPITSLISALIGPTVALAVYLMLAGISGNLHWTVLLLPIPALLLFAFLLGCAWTLMIPGVLLKDLREVVGVFLGLLIYLSPVVLSEKIAGPRIWHALQFNPLFHVVECFRDVFDGKFHAVSWIVFVSMTFVALALGTFVLNRARAILNELI